MPAPTEARPRASLTLLIGSPRAEILRLVSSPVTCGEIAKHLFIAPGGVTHHLRTLEAAGLVRRTRHGRHVVVERTARGRAVMALFEEDETVSELIASHGLSQAGHGLDTIAADWFAALPEEAVLADARLCLVCGWTAFATGRLTDVLRWAAAAERAPLPAPFRDGTSSVSAGVATLRASYWLSANDIDEAGRWAREAMRLQEDPRWCAVVTNCLATCRYWVGDEEGAIALHERAIRLSGDEMPLIAVVALGRLGVIAAFAGDWSRCRRLVQQARRTIDAHGLEECWMTCTARLAYGAVLAKDGHLARADAEVERALELAGRGGGSLDIVLGLAQLAELRATRGDPEHAKALLAQARARVDALPGALAPAPLQHAERRLSEPRDESRVAAGCDLSAREHAVLRLLASPLTQREIGRELHVSVNTIKTHARSIFRKLGVSTRREAVERAYESGVM